MRTIKKGRPITIRLFKEEEQRVDEVFAAFKRRYGFAKLADMIRIWLNLPVEDVHAVLTEGERRYLSDGTGPRPEVENPADEWLPRRGETVVLPSGKKITVGKRGKR